MSKLKTAFWFMKNPKYVPQILQILKRHKHKALENTRKDSTVWCQKHYVSQTDALKQLTGLNNISELDKLFPDVMKKAIQKELNTPVKMGGAGAISLIYHLVKISGAKKILETGVAYGWSSLAILLAIRDFADARLISNDMPYVSMNNEDYVGCIIPENLRAKWDLQRQPDIIGIPLALKKFENELDFCHYDSDKSYTGRMWASPLLWKALKKGSFFVADDINDNVAFKHFCESVDRHPIIIKHEDKYVGIITK